MRLCGANARVAPGRSRSFRVYLSGSGDLPHGYDRAKAPHIRIVVEDLPREGFVSLHTSEAELQNKVRLSGHILSGLHLGTAPQPPYEFIETFRCLAFQ